MNIDTDFADHWKTQRLVDKCGASAALCLIRIWAFCQSGKTDRIKDCTPQKLESIARWRGEMGGLFENLLEVGFIEQDGGDVVMHDFKSRNAKLCANWKNGAKGGRAKRKTADSGKKSKTQTEFGLTHEEPTENPNTSWVNPQGTQTEFGLTHGEPTENPNQVWVNPLETQNEFGLTHAEPTRNPNASWVNPQGTQTEFGLTQNEFGFSETANKKDEKKKKNFPPHPPYKEKEKQKEQTARDARGCVDFFSEELSKAGVLGESDLGIVVAGFADFAKYRATVLRKPIKPPTGARHAHRVVRRLLEDRLSARDIVALFGRSMDNDWQGWDFDSEVQKLKADVYSRKKEKTAPDGAEFSMGSFGVPAGAFEGGAL